MLIVLSPAKNLNFEALTHDLETTQPRLTSDTAQLIKRTKRLSRSDLRKLMGISDALADLNYDRFQALAKGLPAEEAKTAIHAFNGDVYRGLDAEHLSDDDISWAQDHLRMLSGLYGLLRPLDLIHPYRLEMGSRLDTRRGSDLYDFWGSRISKLINEDIQTASAPVINLASKEYFSAIDKKALKSDVIDIVFKEEKDGKSRIMAFYAKYARGVMANWIIKHRLTNPDELKAFDLEGYRYQSDASSAQTFVFSRPQPEPKK